MTVVEGHLTESDAAAVESVAADAERHDGVAPLGEQPLRALRSSGLDDDQAPTVRHLLVREPDAGVAAYAQVTGTGGESTAELVVVPAHRRRGIGTDLLGAVLEREPGAAVWAHGDLPAARATAHRSGLERTRELLKMRRRGADGPALAAVTPAEGIETGTLHEAASEGGGRWPGLDARAEFLRVNNAAFYWHPEQGGWSRGQLDDRLAVDWVDPQGIFLAVDVTGERPRLAGFHWTKTVRGADPAAPVEGEVYVVGVDPADQGRGLGGLLTTLGVAHLEDEVGADAVVLYVEGDNTPARRTYERLGFVVEHVDATYSRVASG